MAISTVFPKPAFFKNSLILIVLVVLCSSCSIQKRLYTAGYYHDRNKDAAATLPGRSKTPVPSTVSDEINPSPEHTTFSHSKRILLTGGCDTIFLNDGKIIVAEIVDVTLQMVRYKTCNNTTALPHDVMKSKVGSIHYSDGRRSIPANEHLNVLDEKYTPPANSVMKNSPVVKQGRDRSSDESGCSSFAKTVLWVIIVIAVVVGVSLGISALGN
ncbi:MAG: hypothetical protein ACHQRM_11470 [Bacteroidia bacterium]